MDYTIGEKSSSANKIKSNIFDSRGEKLELKKKIGGVVKQVSRT